jgi:hypothetical protein
MLSLIKDDKSKYKPKQKTEPTTKVDSNKPKLMKDITPEPKQI